MQEKSFGPIRFILGQNRGKYPYCHSLYIDGDGILIDPSSDRALLGDIRKHSGVRAVWLSHWHEDHLMHLDLFDDLPLWVSEQDAIPLSDPETFLDWYGINDQALREYWRPQLIEEFHIRPRKPAGYLPAGGRIHLNSLTVEVIPTPGHTPGHRCFFFEEPGVLFMGDYDLTKFGPWYGDLYSDIAETIASVKRLRQVPANVWLTGHETGIFESEPGQLWDDYLNVIWKRQDKLLTFLKTPRTMEQILDAWIVYGRPREPKEFYEFGERAIMTKHLEMLQTQRVVAVDGDRFHLTGKDPEGI